MSLTKPFKIKLLFFILITRSLILSAQYNYDLYDEKTKDELETIFNNKEALKELQLNAEKNDVFSLRLVGQINFLGLPI